MFGKTVEAVILAYALEHPTEEVCGYINENNEFVELTNNSPDRENAFEIGTLPHGAKAIVHSHPGGPFYPSELDMKQQLATALPWGICSFSDIHCETFWFGDECPKAPLIGRGFRHGVTDCYSLIRDFYKVVHDIELMEFPRSWQWWNTDKKLYLEGFAETGFREVNVSEILPGDVFFATVGHEAKSANHAGVYIGNGLILHHSAGRQGYDPSRLSTVESGARWMHLVTKVVRHENDKIDRSIGQTIWK